MQATPIDLFPHTKLCELVLLFERVSPKEKQQELRKIETVQQQIQESTEAEAEKVEPEESEKDIEVVTEGNQ